MIDLKRNIFMSMKNHRKWASIYRSIMFWWFVIWCI